jgi:hypothetical protein
MKIIGVIAAAAFAVSVLAFSPAQAGSAKPPADATPPEGVTVLSEDELAAVFVENTLFGLDYGKKYWEYYKPNGSIKGLWDRDKYRGKWSIASGMFCLDYQGTGYDGCWYVQLLEGNKLQWYKPDGTDDGEDGEMLEGNPKNL